MYVCLCYGISDKELQKLIAQGVCSVKQVQQKCLAGTNCGSCLPQIKEELQRCQSGCNADKIKMNSNKD
jgi:bacterioferritin-associated ferredoxin